MPFKQTGAGGRLVSPNLPQRFGRTWTAWKSNVIAPALLASPALRPAKTYRPLIEHARQAWVSRPARHYGIISGAGWLRLLRLASPREKGVLAPFQIPRLRTH